MIILAIYMIMVGYVGSMAIGGRSAFALALLPAPYVATPIFYNFYFDQVFSVSTVAVLFMMVPLTLVSLLLASPALPSLRRSVAVGTDSDRRKFVVSLGCFCLLLLLLFANYGSAVLSTKIDGEGGPLHESRLFILVYGLAGVCVALSSALPKKYMIISTVLISAFILTTGDRTQPFVMGLFMLIVLNTRPEISLKSRYVSAIGAAAFFVVLGLYGKYLYSAIVSSFSNSSAIQLEFVDAQSSVGASEPVFIWKNFQAVRDLQLGIPSRDYISELLVASPINIAFSNEQMHSFSEIIKGNIYPLWSSSVGVGSNWLAEGYATAGWIGLIAYVLIYLLVPIVMFVAIRKGVFDGRVGLFLIVFWYSYIWRNGLASIISHEKKFVWTYLLVVLIYTSIDRVFWRSRRSSSNRVQRWNDQYPSVASRGESQRVHPRGRGV